MIYYYSYTPGLQQPLSADLEVAGTAVPSLSENERVVMTSGGAASGGLGCLVVLGGRQLLALATAVAALSCEAFGAQVRGSRRGPRCDTVNLQPA